MNNQIIVPNFTPKLPFKINLQSMSGETFLIERVDKLEQQTNEKIQSLEHQIIEQSKIINHLKSLLKKIIK